MHCPTKTILLITSMICNTLAARKPKIPPRALSQTTCTEGLFETNTISFPFTLSAIAPSSKEQYNITLTYPNLLLQSALQLSASPYPSEFQLENGRLFNTLSECLLSKTYVGAIQVHCAFYFPTIYSTREYNPDEMQWTAYETCPYGRTGSPVLGLKASVKGMPEGQFNVYQIEDGEYVEWDNVGTGTGVNITLAIAAAKSIAESAFTASPSIEH